MFWANIWKISEFFIWKFSCFLDVKFSIYLNRRVFVMSFSFWKDADLKGKNFLRGGDSLSSYSWLLFRRGPNQFDKVASPESVSIPVNYLSYKGRSRYFDQVHFTTSSCFWMFENSIDPNQMPHIAASDLGLNCLLWSVVPNIKGIYCIPIYERSVESGGTSG